MANTGWPINFVRSPNALYYDYALAAAWQAGAGWIPDPDYALYKDPEIYEKASRDPLVGQAMEQRITDVAGRPIEPQARDPKNPKEMLKAKIHKELLDECGLLSMSMRQLAKFVFQAAAYQFIDGERRWMALGGTKQREKWWVPTRLKDVGWRRVRYATDYVHGDDGKRTRSTWMELFSIDGHNFVRLKDTRRFVRCLYDDSESGLNYGLGMMAALAHYLWMTEKVTMYGMQWLERWALGMLEVGVDAEAPGAKDINNTQIRNNYAAALRAMQGSHVLVHDLRDKVNTIQPAGESWRAALEFKRELQDCMVRRILSARLTTGGGAGEPAIGGGDRSGEEADATDSLVIYDRGLLFEYLTRDLGGMIEYANAPQFAAMGLADVRPPRYLPQPHERDDPIGAADQLQKLKGLKLQIPLREVHEKIGYSLPQEGEQVLDLGAPDPQAGPTGGLPNLDSMRELPDLDALRTNPAEKKEQPEPAEAAA